MAATDSQPANAVTSPKESAEGRAEASSLVFYALLLAVVVVWGGSFVAARGVLSAGAAGSATLSPTLLATIRFVVASVIFLPVLVHQHQRVQPLHFTDMPVFFAVGQVGISIYFWLQYTGVRLTNAGLASVVVVGLIPLATMVVSGVVLGEAIGWRRGLGLVLGTIGVAIVASQQGPRVALESGFLLGIACLVLNAFCFAVYSTLIRGLRARYAPLTTTAAMTVAGAAGLTLISMFTEDWRTLQALSLDQWLAIAYLALVCSVLGYFVYNRALSRIEAARAAAWLYLEPLVAVLLGALLLGEQVAYQTVAGGLVILASLCLTQRGHPG